jgi:hypothetical protein
MVIGGLLIRELKGIDKRPKIQMAKLENLQEIYNESAEHVFSACKEYSGDISDKTRLSLAFIDFH